ncbi:class I SAM-dependent methyltransferase [Nocardia asteroides]
MDYKQQVAQVFDRAAPTYDQLGVNFFTPMGRRLVELVAPQPGERILDVGCGRGASVFPAATAVGAAGSVLGIDLAPGMIEQAQRTAAETGIGNVEFLVFDAEWPEQLGRRFDAVLGSYSVIFLPDPPAALSRYARVLTDGGRLAFTSPVFTQGTFPFLPPMFTPLIPQSLLRHLPPEWQPEELVRRFHSWLEREEDLVNTLVRAGFRDVVVRDEPVRLTTPSGAAWVEWSHTQGMRLLWQSLPPDESATLARRLSAALDELRVGAEPIGIDVPVRFVTAQAHTTR